MRGQYVLPILLLAMAAMILLYLIMVYPWEREKLLFPNATKPTQVEVGETLEGDVLFKQVEKVTIGSGTGARVGLQGPFSFELDYPLVTEKTDEKELQLSANIFSGDLVTVTYDGIWRAKFVIHVSKIEGNPVIEIIRGNTTIFSGTVSAGENITFYLESGEVAKIKIKHGSYAFWMTSKIYGKLVEYEEYYKRGVETYQKHYTDEAVEYLIDLNKAGEIAEIDVVAYGDCLLELKSGDNLLYRGPAESFSIEVPVNALADTLVFVGEKGCNATIDKVTIRYKTKVEGGPYYFSFPVNKSYDHIYLAININGIIEPGDLTITLLPSHKTYIASASDVGLGWNYIELDKEYLEDIGNKAVISSSGKLSAIGFAIVGR